MRLFVCISVMLKYEASLLINFLDASFLNMTAKKI